MDTSTQINLSSFVDAERGTNAHIEPLRAGRGGLDFVLVVPFHHSYGDDLGGKPLASPPRSPDSRAA